MECKAEMTWENAEEHFDKHEKEFPGTTAA